MKARGSMGLRAVGGALLFLTGVLAGMAVPEATALQGEEKGLKEIRQHLQALNDLAGAEKVAVRADDGKLLDQLHEKISEEKGKILKMPQFANSKVFGVSVADWMSFFDAFDFGESFAGHLFHEGDTAGALFWLDDAIMFKEALEKKLPAKK